MLRALGCAVLAALLCPAIPVQAQTGAGGVGVSGGPGYAAVEPLLGGETITGVSVVFEPEDAQRAETLEAGVRHALRIGPGDRWEPTLGAAALAAVRALPGVRDATITARRDGEGTDRRLVVTLHLAPSAKAPAPGFLISENVADLPVLYRRDGTFLKLELSAGSGVFSDGNPWFGNPQVFTLGNPLVEDPKRGAGTGNRATWAEGFVHFGLGGVTPLGGDDLYVFGAATAIAPGSVGQDIFRDDTRSSFDVEKLYAGLLYAPADSDLRLKVSVGRQNFTLNDGFLVSQFGSQWNAGPRPGVYLAPRTAHDMSVLATARKRDWSMTGFFLDPNEYEPIESNTRLLGLNARRAVDERLSLDASVLYVPESDTQYRAPDGLPRGREGLWTLAGHLHRRPPPGEPGVWVKGELARQWHEDFDMDARAGYGEFGYLARDLPWTPSLSYRLAHFTGDDPATSRYERFDTLYSGGLDHWLQGISINKLLTQANRTTHRIRFNVAPDPKLNLTLDLYRHIADERNNLGANPALSTLASRELGDEIQFTARWAVSPGVFFLGIAGIAFPGSAIEAATPGSDKPWTTLQAQLFWGF
jgi:hypothetical protein